MKRKSREFVLGLTFLMAVFFLSNACQKDHLFDCFKGTGNTVTEKRVISGFTEIEMNDNVDVVVKPGADFEITVEAGSKLIDGIVTEKEGNRLFIRNENKCNWVRSFKNKFTVTVSLPEIIKFESYGSGNVNFIDTIRTNEFQFDNSGGSGSFNFLMNVGSCRTNVHTGVCDVNYHGHIGVHYFYYNGNGPFNTLNCQSDIVFTENKGTNDIKIFATKFLDAKSTYVGNIYYKGTPDSLRVREFDKGKIIRID
jgi:hypothetical protein